MSGQGVIFDLDGTLADTLPDLADAVNTGLRAFGLPDQPASQIKQWVGDGLPTLCQRAIAGTSLSPPLTKGGMGGVVPELVAIITASYREHRLRKTQPFAGIPDLLDQLSQRGILMAVLTNKPHEHTVPMVEALFGRRSFIAVEGYREESRKKPDPRTALEVVSKMNLAPAQVFMVGDSAADIQTAINAGLVPVGATWGYRSREELIHTGAKHLIDHPRQLLDLLA